MNWLIGIILTLLSLHGDAHGHEYVANPELFRIAQYRAESLASQQILDNHAGYVYPRGCCPILAENLGRTQCNVVFAAPCMMNAFLASPSHAGVIRDIYLTNIGIGVAYNYPWFYVAIEYGGP